jgi:hypothetical protein
VRRRSHSSGAGSKFSRTHWVATGPLCWRSSGTSAAQRTSMVPPVTGRCGDPSRTALRPIRPARNADDLRPAPQRRRADRTDVGSATRRTTSPRSPRPRRLRYVAADHRPHQIGYCQLAGSTGRDPPPIAQDRHPVGGPSTWRCDG